MNPISFALIAVFLFAASLAHAECKHLPLAIEHTKLSLAEAKAGKSGGTPLLMGNLSNALEHAKASEKAEKNVHTSEAIVHLEAAISSAQGSESTQCQMHTQEALKHLELAGQCPKK